MDRLIESSVEENQKISVGDLLIYKDLVDKNEYIFLVTKTLIHEYRFQILVLHSPGDLFKQNETVSLTADSTVGTKSTVIKGQN